MRDGDVTHFALDHEGKTRREKAFQKYAVEVTRVIGDDDTAAVGQVLEAIDLRPHAGEQEGRASRAGNEPAAPLEAGDEHRHEK